MNLLLETPAAAILEHLGWTLLHSLWQFALAAILLAGVLGILQRQSANLRYVVACFVLVAMFAGSVTTFFLLPVRPLPVPAGRTPSPRMATPIISYSAGDVTSIANTIPRNDRAGGIPSLSGAAQKEVLAEPSNRNEGIHLISARVLSGIQAMLTPWLPWITVLWISGVVLLSLWNLGGWIGIQRLRHIGTGPAAREIAECAASLINRMRIRRSVQVFQSTLVAVPVVAGWLAPVILLPAGLLGEMSAAQWEAILAHELAHIGRYDYLVNLLQTVAETLMFYHPAVWWVSRRIRIEREHCCDDAAVRLCGSGTDLGEALTLLAASRLTPKPVLAASDSRCGSVLGRVRRLLEPKAEAAAFSKVSAAVVVLALLGLVGTVMVGWGHVAKADLKEKPADGATSGESSKETAGASATCRVIDSDGMGIASATIAPRVQGGLIPSWKATTDLHGQCSLPPLAPGAHELIRITAPGFLAREMLRRDGHPLSDITLQRAGSIAGRVLGTDGKPLPRTPLALGIVNMQVGENRDYLHAISDAEGNFKIENIPPGVAVVYYPGRAPSEWELTRGRETKLLPPGQTWPSPPVANVFGSIVVELNDGEHTQDVVMDLSQSTCDVEGRVTGPDGRRLPDATVSAKRFHENLSFKNLIHQIEAGEVQAKTDAAGRYKLEHLPRGKWALSVWSPHYQRLGRIEFVDFVSPGQQITQDLRVYERYEAQDVFPAEVAIERADTLKEFPEQLRFIFEIPTMARYPGLPPHYAFAELTVNSVPRAEINIEPLHLPADATPEQIAMAAHVGELYYIAPDMLVTVNGTILAPCTLPPKNNAQETPRSRLSRLTRTQLEEQVKASLRETPPADGRRVKFKKGDWFIAVRNDGKAFLVDIENEQSLSKDYVRLGTYYVGSLEIDSPKAESRANTAPGTGVAPAKSVHGKVLDEEGTPLAGADVWMISTWDPAHSRSPTHTISDPEGRFILPVSPFSDRDLQRVGWPYPVGVVLAYAAGHQLGTAHSGDQILGRDKSDVVLRLGPAAYTPFVVLGPEGQPRAGALVEPNLMNAVPRELPQEVRSRLAAGTDAKGRAVLTALPREALDSIRVVTEDLGIQVQRLETTKRIEHGRDGSLPEYGQDGSLPAGQPIRLRQGGRIVGQVTADKPQWARGIRVLLTTSPLPPPAPFFTQGDVPATSPLPQRLPPSTQGLAEVESDEHGQFVVPVLATGVLSFYVVADDTLPVLPRLPDFNKQPIMMMHPDETRVEIPLVPAVSVHGSVRAKDIGKPIPKSIILIQYGADPQGTLVHSDAEGNFTAAVLPGEIRLHIIGGLDEESRSYVQYGDEPPYKVPENVKDFTLPPLELVPTKSIAGRLVDQRGEPLAKRMVWVMTGDCAYNYATETNANGEFTLTRVPASIDTATAKYQTGMVGKPSGTVEAKVVQASPLVLRLDRAADSLAPNTGSAIDQPPAAKPEAEANAVRGRVIDDSGKPLAGAEAWLPLVMRGVGHVQTLHATSDALGEFTLESVPDWFVKTQPWDRARTLWAYAAGHQLGSEKVTLPDGTSDVVIRLGPATDTSFIVLDPEDRPFAGALVEPFYIKTWQAIQFPPEELLALVSARTDAEGRVKLSAAPRDLLYQVRVTSNDFGIQFQHTIGAPGRPIRLRPAGKIEGRLIANQAEIVRGVRLVFRSQEHREGLSHYPGKEQPTEGFADVKTDEQDRFVVPAIAVGDVTVHAFVNETQPLRPKLPASLRVEAGRTTSLDIPMAPTVVVRGSVRVKEADKPVPGALIHIYYDGGRQGADAVSDTQGQYTARVLPGSIQLQVTAMPKEYAWLHGDAFPFPSHQVPEDAKEFDLPPVEVEPTKSIAGRVVDQYGQPASNIRISVIDGDRHYGRGKSDNNGEFNLAGVPVTINPAAVKYGWLPEVGPGRPVVSTMPSPCEVLKTDPLLLRALPRDPQMDQP